MVKVMFILEQAIKGQSRSRGTALLLFNIGAWWGRVVNTMPWPLHPKGRNSLPIIQDAGWPQGWSGWVWKISPQPGLYHRTVQPVVSRCTD